jgi:hypothetical protein
MTLPYYVKHALVALAFMAGTGLALKWFGFPGDVCRSNTKARGAAMSCRVPAS